MMGIGTVAKAVCSGLVAGLGSLAAVLVGPASLSSVTDGQWVTIALAVLLAVGSVYGVPNARPAPPSPPAAGG